MVIRTRLVELTSLEAVAYRQKLRGGQVGVVIRRHDAAQPGLALLDRRTGQPEPAAHVPLDLYPLAAFQEALDLTAGLPYSSRGPAGFPGAGSTASDAGEDLLAAEPLAEDLATVNSADYAAVVKAYTNRKGELSYELLNKALIQAAHSNPYIATLVERGASLEEIRDHMVKAVFEVVTANRSLSQAAVQRILELLDDVSPRSVLREFNDDLRRLLATASG